MKVRTFVLISSVIFGIIAILHLLRVIFVWDAQIGSLNISVWSSWIALIIAGFLSITGFNLIKNR